MEMVFIHQPPLASRPFSEVNASECFARASSGDTSVMYNHGNNPGNQTLHYNIQFNQQSVVIIYSFPSF